jgi:S1-C subfamily serine protease
MSRTAVVFVLLLPALAAGADKDTPKPGFLGVQIAKGAGDAVVVLMVIDKSPAAKAGLQTGDLIVRIDGVKPADLKAAVEAVRSLKPGKKVKLLIRRDGKEKTIEATPTEAP